MNCCRSCNQDFGSVSAFDAHRTGTHAYTYSEGLKQEPPVENGRRCLSTREMANTTLQDGTSKFIVNKRGQWSLARGVGKARTIGQED